MRIAVTGSTGLIGSALVRSLLDDGHEVVRLVRREPQERADGSVEVRWNPPLKAVDRKGLEGVDAAVNLAGAGIGDHRWTDAYKQTLRDSRILSTLTLADALAGLERRPRVLVSGSAMGYYGQTGDAVIDEDAPAGEDFLARLCVEWEEAAGPAVAAGIRVAHTRSGIVVDAHGGAFARLLPLFKLGLGGRLGNGQQYWSFISLRDEVAAIRHLIDTDRLSGAFNLTAPVPVANAEVTTALSRALRRPAALPVPEFALRAVLGEMAVEVVGSHRCVPRRLLDSGFRFAHATIDQAVAAAL